MVWQQNKSIIINNRDGFLKEEGEKWDTRGGQREIPNFTRINVCKSYTRATGFEEMYSEHVSQLVICPDVP